MQQAFKTFVHASIHSHLPAPYKPVDKINVRASLLYIRAKQIDFNRHPPQPTSQPIALPPRHVPTHACHGPPHDVHLHVPPNAVAGGGAKTRSGSSVLCTQELHYLAGPRFNTTNFAHTATHALAIKTRKKSEGNSRNAHVYAYLQKSIGARYEHVRTFSILLCSPP